jgi:hypothetical protein
MDLFHLAALCLCLYLMYQMVGHTQKAQCQQCGGEGRHKDDCPFNKEND